MTARRRRKRGEGETPPPSSIPDTRLFSRALREGWPVPVGKRAAVVGRLIEVALDPQATAREVASAARVLVSASQVSLTAITTALRVRESEEFAARLDQLEQGTAAVDPIAEILRRGIEEGRGDDDEGSQ
jgi:hypothetical protein